MFDVGFWELCLVGLVGLLVIGPEKLPKVARVIGFWVGKSRHILTTVKAEIKQELQAEEIQQILKEQSQTEAVQQILKGGTDAVDEIKNTLKPPPKKDSSNASK